MVFPLCLGVAFFLFGGFSGLGVTSSNSPLELVVVLELEEEEGARLAGLLLPVHPSVISRLELELRWQGRRRAVLRLYGG